MQSTKCLHLYYPHNKIVIVTFQILILLMKIKLRELQRSLSRVVKLIRDELKIEIDVLIIFILIQLSHSICCGGDST